MFFLDYISCGKLEIAKMNEIVQGIVEGCKLAGTSLVGGETAEHPGLLKPDEYDIAGFCVGAVEKKKLIDGSAINTGDVLIGIESSGLHSNGFSLIRTLLLENGKLPINEEKIKFIREYIMTPTKIYVKSILALLGKYTIHGMVHVTGGGYYENIPRVLNQSQAVNVFSKNLPKLYVYERLMKDYRLDQKDMFSTFNMGTGFILVAPGEQTDSIIEELKNLGEKANVIGEVVNSSGEQILFI